MLWPWLDTTNSVVALEQDGLFHSNAAQRQHQRASGSQHKLKVPLVVTAFVPLGHSDRGSTESGTHYHDAAKNKHGYALNKTLRVPASYGDVWWHAQL